MTIFKDICICFMVAFMFNLINVWIESTFLNHFLNENLINIQLSIMAITIATYTFIISKLEELAQKYESKFDRTYQALRGAIHEQLCCIGLTTLLLIVKNSTLSRQLPHFDFVIDTLISTVFIYAISILKDVGSTIFILIDIFKQLKDKSSNKN